MSTSRANRSCKKCKRESKISFASSPSVLITHTGNGTLSFDTELLIMMIMNNFDGDLSSHCIDAARAKIDADISAALLAWANNPEISDYLCFDAQKPNPPCYAAYVSNDYKITMKCKCNDQDIYDGKGPPKAAATSNGMSMVVSPLAMPCTPQGGGNLGLGLRC